jgi:acyl-CoA thioester hydrolase
MTNPNLDATARITFDHPIRASLNDVDANGHVNNVVYLRWVQEAAVAHWSAAASAAVRSEVSWVVVRHEIDFKRPAFAGDALVARTWVEEITAATTERHCEVLRVSDSALLARALTIWCSIDPRTGKPRRIHPLVRSYFLADRANVAVQPGAG